MRVRHGIVAVFFAALAAGPRASAAAPWSFGVMGDTQWTLRSDPAVQNPKSVAKSIIDQVNAQFIKAGVTFVIQVGDLTDNGTDAAIVVRAKAAQSLYDAGIGFFPMRGNHETGTPRNNHGITQFRAGFPQTRGLGNTFGAANFSSPTAVSSDLKGMSYSFDYGPLNNNARLVILDNWATLSKKAGYSIAEQQSWINSRLDKNTRGAAHAFVFSHQNLIGANHQDCLFSGYTNANPDMQNDFLAALQNNGVRFYLSGHDHLHQRSLIASPDGASRVQQIIAASNSSKFYTPRRLTDPKWYGQKSRETPLSQELYAVGYYIYTVDGPRVTAAYYADDHGNWQSDKKYPDGSGSKITPTFHFVKKETWGYGLNGKEMLVAQGGSYALTDDTREAVAYAHGESVYVNIGTTARILSGSNGSTKKDYTGRALAKIVATGWSSTDVKLASDVFRLWGMTDLGQTTTDPFLLSISYDPSRLPAGGAPALVSRSSGGPWQPEGTKFLGDKDPNGMVASAETLGQCGYDSARHTVWAVVNHDGDFAAAPNPAAATAPGTGPR